MYMSTQVKIGKGLSLFLGLFLLIIGCLSLFSGDGGAELNEFIGESYRGDSNIYTYAALPLTLGFFTVKAAIKAKKEYLYVGIIGFVFILLGRFVHLVEAGVEDGAYRPVLLGVVYLVLYFVAAKLLTKPSLPESKKDKKEKK